MDNYDDWKLMSDIDENEELNECRFCSKECENDYCDSKCYKEDLK